jgi:hypothetical protein
MSAHLAWFFSLVPLTQRLRICCLCWAGTCLLSAGLLAQRPTAASSTSQTISAALDTTPLLYAYERSPEQLDAYRDTLPDYGFRMYDPARQQKIDWGTLGNLGTAARPLLFENPPQIGFHTGVRAYDLYQLRPADLRFYQHTRSFSEVFFSQGRTQFDGLLNAKFARSFSGGTRFSLDYRTINNQGQYRFHRSRHTSLSMGLWIPVTKRYDIILIFTKNTIRQRENGGIVTDTVFGGESFTGAITAPIWLTDQTAQSRIANQYFHLTQHLKFLGNEKAGKRVLRASHTLEWSQSDFKFYDSPLNNNRAYYDTFLVDLRGIRHFIHLDQLDNAFSLTTFKAPKSGRPADLLSVGLRHSLFRLNQEPENSVFSNYFLTGRLAITPSERLGLNAQAQLGLLKNLGEYQVDADIYLGLGKAGKLKAGISSRRYPVALLYNRFYISKRLFWQNDFLKPFENTLWGTYSLPLAGFEATVRTQLINNYLYYNQARIATQTTAPIQLFQLVLSENIRVGRWHLDNTFALQQSNRKDIIRLPEWFSKNSLYYQGPIFKKNMFFSAGIDFRINAPFTPDGYNPLNWQFHLQDSIQQAAFPWVDAFIAFKVQTFRFFIRYENMYTLLEPSTVFYQTARYPQPFKGIRIGINWRFMDNNRREDGSTTPTNTTLPNGGTRPNLRG